MSDAAAAPAAKEVVAPAETKPARAAMGAQPLCRRREVVAGGRAVAGVLERVKPAAERPLEARVARAAASVVVGRPGPARAEAWAASPVGVETARVDLVIGMAGLGALLRTRATDLTGGLAAHEAGQSTLAVSVLEERHPPVPAR